MARRRATAAADEVYAGAEARLHAKPQLRPVRVAVHEIEAVVVDVDALGATVLSAEAPIRLNQAQPARFVVRLRADATQVGATHAQFARPRKGPSGSRARGTPTPFHRAVKRAEFAAKIHEPLHLLWIRAMGLTGEGHVDEVKVQRRCRSDA